MFDNSALPGPAMDRAIRRATPGYFQAKQAATRSRNAYRPGTIICRGHWHHAAGNSSGHSRNRFHVGQCVANNHYGFGRILKQGGVLMLEVVFVGYVAGDAH